MAAVSPFTLMSRVMDDLDRFLEGFDAGPSLLPRIDLGSRGAQTWIPPVELLERDGHLVVRVEVPGMSADQINVEIDAGQLIVSGERRQEQEDRQGGIYRSERIYGSFYRAIPLPEGVNPEQARASFSNGVLEVTMPAAERLSARRVEISEGGKEAQSQSGQQSQSAQGQSAQQPPAAPGQAGQHSQGAQGRPSQAKSA